MTNSPRTALSWFFTGSTMMAGKMIKGSGANSDHYIPMCARTPPKIIRLVNEAVE